MNNDTNVKSINIVNFFKHMIIREDCEDKFKYYK